MITDDFSHEDIFYTASLNAQEFCMVGTEDYQYCVYGEYKKLLGVEWDDINWGEFEHNLSNQVTVKYMCEQQYKLSKL